MMRTINAQAEAEYTLAVSDAGNVVTMSNEAPNTVTVPADESVPIGIGAQIDIVQLGGKITIEEEPGVNIVRAPAGSLLKISANTWVLIGDPDAGL